MRINVSILTPNHWRRSGPGGELVLLSHSFPAIPDSFDEADIERLMEAHGHEWSAIWVERKAGGVKARLWRSLTSTFDVFYTLQDSNVYISDTFAGCAVHLPRQARVPSRDAILDHFLFRTPFGENTYFDDVRRVGHGMRVDIHVPKLTIEKEQFATYAPMPESQVRSEERGLQNVDAALESALAEFRGDDYALLFSGGVDSTLLATYLPPNPLTNNALMSPEFVREGEYARSSARLLGKDISVNRLQEADFLRRFEEIVDNLWMPPTHAQTIVLSAAFKSDYDRFIIGQLADGLFGLFPHNRAYYGPILAKPVLRHVTALLAMLPSAKLQSMNSVAQSFHIPPIEPGSFAFRFACAQTFATPGRFFTQQEINRRLDVRLESITRFLGFESTRPERDAHLEIGQQLDYFCDDTISIWRQMAASYGKCLYAPFVNPRVFAAAMSIPSGMRYMNSQTEKHILKNLLVRRLPQYPVDQPKLAGAVPLRRFAEEGPLKNWTERYPPPEFIDKKNLEKMQRSERAAFWNTLLYSVWKGRIAELDATPAPLVVFEAQSAPTAATSDKH